MVGRLRLEHRNSNRIGFAEKTYRAVAMGLK